ncbi:hypothetical protein LNV08_06540 [Paucibacter sp. TC2R-5]|uniref:hypothetical protein n=1 Tax=Paucibacter sp. TC2R-5 TaxID=2893555 RepID=UPI0021E3E1E5|nr:hypothetical protein [Paucibacter sp. TC2R-5]MCV2358632.1 hypothetical protein [Paucibacter sp. TC2R-5]
MKNKKKPKRRVAPVLNTRDGEELGIRLEYGIACLERGLPFSPFPTDQEDQIEAVRELVLRLLRSGMASAALQARLADLIEQTPAPDLPATLSFRLPKRRKDFAKRLATFEAYFYCYEKTGDMKRSVIAAYEKHFGAGSFQADSRIEDSENDKWSYKDIACTTASKRTLHTIKPLLKGSPHPLPRPERLLRLLGFAV